MPDEFYAIRTEQWRFLDPSKVTSNRDKHIIHRLNSLGNLFYFTSFTLRKRRLTEALHKLLTDSLERTYLKEVVEWPRDHFKALDVETLIPTPTGFKKMLHIQIGDEVFSQDGSITNVTNISDVMLDSICYKITFSTGEKVICDAEHLWIVDNIKKRRNGSKHLRNISQYCFETSKTSDLANNLICAWKYDKNGKTYPEYNYGVQVASFIQTKDNELEIEPYSLGVWLGDGNSDGAYFTSEDREIATNCMLEGQLTFKTNTDLRYGFINLRTKLKKQNLLHNKHIPEVYMWSSPSQRLSLVQGLMDTDGSVNKEGQCSFSNTNYKLVTQFRTLLCSLGYKPDEIGTYKARLNGEYLGNFYVVNFYASPENSPFKMERKCDRLREIKNKNVRKIVAIEKCESVPVKCITVEHPSKTYLVGEGFIPTHNSTIAQSAAIWWALPFSTQDEDWMRRLGYGDEWIKWMHRAHNQNTRTLIASENIKNAAKMGFRIAQQYEQNDLFLALFPEVKPDESCKWTEISMHHKRTKAADPQGEGTYDMIGVGGALQSTHYDRMILDDLFGKKAMQSETVAADTIEWFKLVVGAMDASQVNADIDNDELVIGNRWAIQDLNAWIRRNLPYYRFTNHSALGGCCAIHPLGEPIFPEEFSVGKLLRWKMRLGTRLFSCQFLNDPVAEGSLRWREEFLNYFHFERASFATIIKNGQTEFLDKRAKIVHETKNGKTPVSFFPKDLVIRCIIDPNHSGNTGRCRHAITVTGTLLNKRTLEDGTIDYEKRVYLLETWAEPSTYNKLDEKIVEIVQRWKLKEIWLEVVAAQKYLKHHLEFLFKLKSIRCVIKPLKENKTENAKYTRIESLDTLFESGQFYCQRKDLLFLDEYGKYATRNANKSLIDILDTLGYYNEVCDDTQSTIQDVRDFMERVNAHNPYKPQNRNNTRPASITGY